MVGLLSRVSNKNKSRLINRLVMLAIDWLGKYYISYGRYYAVTPRELP